MNAVAMTTIRHECHMNGKRWRSDNDSTDDSDDFDDFDDVNDDEHENDDDDEDYAESISH